MSVFARVVLTPQAKADIRTLPEEVRRAVIEVLLLVEADLELGRTLEANDATGDLRGCRKVYVDAPGPGKPRFRLVYWLAPSSANPRLARVLAVGKRAGLAVYAVAADRYNPDRAEQGLAAVESLTDEELGLAP